MSRHRDQLFYDQYLLPARHEWTAGAPCGRAEVPALLAALESVILAAHGGYFYTRRGGDTTCRFDWHMEGSSELGLLRIGALFTVSDRDVSKLRCWLTTNRLVENPALPLDARLDQMVEAAHHDVRRMFRRAFRIAMGRAPLRTFRVVSHMMVGGGCALGEIVTLGSAVCVFPTVIARPRAKTNDRISALVITVKARTKQEASESAHRTACLVHALATLATSLPFTPYRAEWMRRHPRREFARDRDLATPSRLYPRHYPGELRREEISDELPTQLQLIHSAYAALAEDEARLFESATLAYFAAIEIDGAQPTAAVAILAAAMNVLAAHLTTECSEKITCPTHGPLPFRHKSLGEARAITELVRKTLKLEQTSKDARDASKLIARIYAKQRSAFVHGAVMRHAEYRSRSAATMRPSESGAYNERMIYANDAESFKLLVRRVLVCWLADHSNHDLSRLEGSRGRSIMKERNEEAAIAISSKYTVRGRIQPWHPEELEALKRQQG